MTLATAVALAGGIGVVFRRDADVRQTGAATG